LQLVVDNSEIVEGVKHRRQEVRPFFGVRRDAEDPCARSFKRSGPERLCAMRSWTVTQYLDAWLAHKRVTVGFKTYLAYELHVAHVPEAVAGGPANREPAKGARAQSPCRLVQRTAYPGKKSKTPVQKISPRTVHHVFSTLRTAMHDALDDGAITVLPFAKRMSPKKGRAEISALDETTDCSAARLSRPDIAWARHASRDLQRNASRRAAWPYVGCNRLGEPGATCAPVP